jgi:hypothetical protein
MTAGACRAHHLIRQFRRCRNPCTEPEGVKHLRCASGRGRERRPAVAASGERVLDVPAKLAARVRVFDTGLGRKTDATDAHSIVMVALRDKGLREVRGVRRGEQGPR